MPAVYRAFGLLLPVLLGQGLIYLRIMDQVSVAAAVSARSELAPGPRELAWAMHLKGEAAKPQPSAAGAPFDHFTA